MKLPIPGTDGLEINESDYKFLQKIAKSDFVGLIGGDWIKLWRWQNLTRIAEKVRKKCEEQGIDPRQVAPKFIREFFENASLEENDDIQGMWANLLVNQTANGDINIYYISILKELEPKEARLLNNLYGQSGDTVMQKFDFARVQQAFNMDEMSLRIMIHKLYGFNILRPPLMEGIGFGNDTTSYSPALETTDIFRFTEMGLDFCKKCNGRS